MRYKRIVFIVLLLSTFNSFSQDRLLDYYVDKKGDTIFGMIRNGLLKTAVLIEENKDKSSNLIYKSHALRKVNQVRYQGKLFQWEKEIFSDGIYEQNKTDTTVKTIRNGSFVFREPKLKDFLILKTNDTIYGTIRNPLLGQMFIESKGEKIKIDRETVNFYRYSNELFELKEKPRVEVFDNKEDFMKVLIDGKMKLYNYESARYKSINNMDYVKTNYMFVEKNGELIYFNPIKFTVKAKEVFSDCPEIMKKIEKDYFVYEDLYSMVIIYNNYQNNK